MFSLAPGAGASSVTGRADPSDPRNDLSLSWCSEPSQATRPRLVRADPVEGLIGNEYGDERAG